MIQICGVYKIELDANYEGQLLKMVDCKEISIIGFRAKKGSVLVEHIIKYTPGELDEETDDEDPTLAYADALGELWIRDMTGLNEYKIASIEHVLYLDKY